MAISLMAHPVRDSFSSSYSHPYSKYMDQPRHLNAMPAPASYQTGQDRRSAASSHRPTSPAASSDDGFRPSLPSISSLLGLADGPKHDKRKSALAPYVLKPQSHALPAPQRSPVTSHPQQQTQYLEPARPLQPPSTPATFLDHRSSFPGYESSAAQRTRVPPTPPLRNDSVIEGRRSPLLNISPRSTYSQPYHHSTAVDHHDTPRTAAYLSKRQSLPAQPSASPYAQANYTTSPYATSPGSRSNASVYSAPEPAYPVPHPPADLYHQRPLPTNFPPQAPTLALQPPTSSAMPTNNPWEHHHYINPSSSAHFPQSTERYICPTCNKAFSRPSSLKIHIHSHTGEKPFKCPHDGCQKAFSVRSNMKRHERGCHTGTSAAAAGLSETADRLM